MEQILREQLRKIVGSENYSEAVIDLVSYSYDASDHSHRPHAAVWATDRDQVAGILKLAHEHRFPVTPRGGGTGLAGSAVPARGGVVLDLSRMNQILGISIPDRQAVVQPGVVYARLDRELAKEGFAFPPDPASGKVCTLGGNVATNAGGIRGAKYGVTRDYVLALEVVLPRGEIMRTGARCIKSSSGLDLTRLFVGSEGVLGVITEITLKISPRPLAFRTAAAFFKSLEGAGNAVAGIMQSGIIPSVLEVLDSNSIHVLRTVGKVPLPEAEACLLVETDGYTGAEAEYQMQKVIGVFKENGAAEVKTSEAAAEESELWSIRKKLGAMAAGLRPNNISEDVTVPISRVPEALRRISDLVKEQGFPFVVFGHAGDGNLHPKIMYDRTDPDQCGRIDRLAGNLFGLTCNLGGTLTGEHGIGLAKAPFMGLEHDAPSMTLMREIKRLVDPHHILNPGKMQLD